MRVFITGITSETGDALAQQFRSTGNEVWGLSRNNNRDARILKGDLCRITNLDLPSDIVFDLLIHAAAYVPLNEANSNWAECFDSNLHGTQNIFSLLAGRIKKIILISSCAVYGRSQGRIITESQPPLPITAYAVSKLGQESISSCFCQINKLPLAILRLGYIYGRNMNSERVVKRFLLKILNNEPIELINEEETILNLINVGDIAKLIHNHCETLSGVYNLVNTERVSLRQFIDVAETSLNKKANLMSVRDYSKPPSDCYISERLPFSDGAQYTPLKIGIKGLIEEFE
jgi:nucleoside-diphosphate-sugar epimerase